jgi:tetratricopeptide (TPR) repeat protein
VRIIAAFIVALIWGTAPAAAADAPTIAPPPPWVERMEIPAPNLALKERPIQLLLINGQSHYGADGDRSYYVEYATLVQTSGGLAGMGNLEFGWQPDISDLIVHKVHIIRGGKTIDLLAAGQSFTVLRRENNLESAMLDGTLTAVLQPEGLSVGDIVNVAWTIRLKPMAFAPAGENLLSLAHGLPVRHLRFREVWEEGVPMRWRATEAMGKPRVRKTGSASELVLELHDAEGPEPPANAPPRFMLPATLELSAYRSWSEISRLMAPLYAEAEALAPDSPLKAEIGRIAAESPDPKARTLAALRLVQDKIRYFALAMGQGGFVPATADQTWKRRFGDCKGKTVTLLALLSGLGIEAEPVLVSTPFADSLGERLPMIRLFDHVLVRARIGGRSYWLDGTRTGDRDLEDLLSSPFGFGLPVRAAGAELEALPLEPPARPLSDVTIAYDATGGFERLVPVTVELVFRGELATLWRSALALQGEEALRDPLKQQVPRVPNADIELKSLRSDEATGEMHVSFAGRTRMDWNPAPASRALRFEFEHSLVQWTPDFERKEGPFKQAPFALDFPVYGTLRETILLPRGGAGFAVEGKPIDETVAATRVTRTVTLEGGKAVALSSFRRLWREIPAADAKAAGPALARLNESKAYVLAPADYRMSDSERAAIREEVPRDFFEYVDRGYRLMDEGSVNSAVADFDKAIELNPTYARAHADRGVALVHLRRFDEAEAALHRARELDDNDFVVHQGLGMLYLARDKPEEAAGALTRALQLDPDNSDTLVTRAAAYEQLGRLREALTDVERVLALAPDDRRALSEKARLHAGLGEAEAALAADARLVALDPGGLYYVGNRGDLLSRLGRRDEAMAAWDKALALIDAKLKAPDADESNLLQQKINILILRHDYKAAVGVADARLRRYRGNVVYLGLRCLARAEGGIELPLARQDCDEAIRFDAGAVAAFYARGLVKLRLGDWDGAIADYGSALALEPQHFRALYGRGIAHLRKGEREAGERDLAAARRLSFDVAAEYAWSGITP